MTDVNETLRTNIQAIREERGFTREELSERCDLAPQNVAQLEDGKADLAADDLVKLAVELETRVSDFFVKNGQPEEHAQSLDHQEYNLGSLINGNGDSSRGLKPDLEALLNTAETLMLLLESNGDIHRANEKYETFTGNSPDADRGNPFWKSPLWVDANQRRMKHLIEGVRESQTYCSEVLPVRTLRETTRPMRINLCPIITEEGALRRILFEGDRV